MLRALYDRTMRHAQSPRAYPALFVVAFLESSVFPIPPDVLLVPMVLAAPARAWRIAAIATLASVLGALLGYAIGHFAFEQLGRPVLAFYGKTEAFAAFAEAYNRWGAWAVLVAGLSPFPYKVITILSGATGLDLATFVIASIIARGARFFVEAALLRAFGPPIRGFIERRLGLVTAIVVLVLLGGFWLVRYL